MKKLIVGLVLILAVVIVGAYYYIPRGPGSGDAVTSGIRIGFSLGTLREERWQRDIDEFTARAKAKGATVTVAYANDDARLQLTQAENLITQGVDVLVVVAQDGVLTSDIVTKAHVAGIPVIAYDRLIANKDLDLFITYDSRLVGELEAKEIVRRVPKGIYAYIGGSTTDNNAYLHKEGAMRVLQPLITKGDITLGLSTFSAGWRPDEAYKAMSAYLKSGKTVNAVVSANDGTAGGVIAALTEAGLAGKVPVAGQDADLAACQRLVSGTQAATVYKPLKQLAVQAADAAITLAKGAKVLTNGTMANGTAKTPSLLLIPILVTSDNLDATVIKDGQLTREEVYRR